MGHTDPVGARDPGPARSGPLELCKTPPNPAACAADLRVSRTRALDRRISGSERSLAAASTGACAPTSSIAGQQCPRISERRSPISPWPRLQVRPTDRNDVTHCAADLATTRSRRHRAQGLDHRHPPASAAATVKPSDQAPRVCRRRVHRDRAGIRRTPTASRDPARATGARNWPRLLPARMRSRSSAA